MSGADWLDEIEAHVVEYYKVTSPNSPLDHVCREALTLVAALRAVLDVVDERDEETADVYGASEVEYSSLVRTGEIRAAFTAALDAS